MKVGLVVLSAAFVACISAFAGPARSDPLRIGLSAPVATLDPHFYNSTPTNIVAFHVFDRLVHRAPDGRLQPGLALSWRPVSDTEWEFKLRPGVVWHDGVPFSAADVAFTLDRAKHVPNNLGGIENLIRTISAVETVAPDTLRLHTVAPTPTLPSDLSFISIVSEHAGRDATSADYNAGKAEIGTGPYRFVSYAPGDRVVLARNDAWWGPKPAWDTVTLQMMTNISTRTAALLAGDLDVIEAPSASDLPRLRADPKLSVVSVPGSRVAYINPVYAPAADAEPITDKDGKPYATTPLRNLKVRQALSLAINRTAIAERVLQGTGVPTGQWLPPGSFSYAADVGVPPYDPAAAKAMLAEAGFPDGFRMKIAVASDRTPYSVEVSQAVAQMWTRIGVITGVDALPFNVYSPKASRQQFQAYFGSLNNPSMEAGLLMKSMLMTVNPAAGTGTFNWIRYSNPALDDLAGRALSTVDDGAREAILKDGVRLVSAEVVFIPLYQFVNLWAARRGLTLAPRADELTLAVDIRPAP